MINQDQNSWKIRNYTAVVVSRRGGKFWYRWPDVNWVSYEKDRWQVLAQICQYLFFFSFFFFFSWIIGVEKTEKLLERESMLLMDLVNLRPIIIITSWWKQKYISSKWWHRRQTRIQECHMVLSLCPKAKWQTRCASWFPISCLPWPKSFLSPFHSRKKNINWNKLSYDPGNINQIAVPSYFWV